jgi:hypothetical protein
MMKGDQGAFVYVFVCQWGREEKERDFHNTKNIDFFPQHKRKPRSFESYILILLSPERMKQIVIVKRKYVSRKMLQYWTKWKVSSMESSFCSILSNLRIAIRTLSFTLRYLPLMCYPSKKYQPF